MVNLLDSYWDTKGGLVAKPVIIEKPYEISQRLDIRNTGDHVIVSLEGITENFVTIGFQHLAIEAAMLFEFNTFTSRQSMYDQIDEVRRILLIKRFEPDDFLLDGFEGYSNDAALQAIWGDTTTNSTLSLLTSARKYGTNSMRVVVGAGGAVQTSATTRGNVGGVSSFPRGEITPACTPFVTLTIFKRP